VPVPEPKAPQAPKAPENLSQTRRRNLLLLLNRHGHAQIDTGQETGAATSFALAIGVHKSLLSKLKGQGPSARDISDAMARQIETRLGLATGWMDTLQPDAPLTSAEQSFLDLCLQAYRSTDARGRTELRRQMKQMGVDLPQDFGRWRMGSIAATKPDIMLR
jgi:hypothetical protein